MSYAMQRGFGEVASGSEPGGTGFPAFSWRLRRANGYQYREIDDEYKLGWAVGLNNVNVTQAAIELQYGALFYEREAIGYLGQGPSPAPHLERYPNLATWVAEAVADGYGIIVKEPDIGADFMVSAWATKKAGVADAITVGYAVGTRQPGVPDKDSGAFVLWLPRDGWSDAKIDPRKPPPAPVEPPTTPAPPGTVPAERRSALSIAVPALVAVAVVGGIYMYSRRKRR